MSLGIATAIWGDRTGLGDLSVGEFVPAVLAYAAVAFGFSVAGLTIAVTLPDAGFTKLLATRPLAQDGPSGFLGSRARKRKRMLAREKPPNAYSDLLFVFSWTALAHWLTVVWAVGMLVACGRDADFIPNGAEGMPFAAGVLVALFVYSALQFLITTLTLSGLGAVYVAELRRRAGQADRPAGRSDPPADVTPSATEPPPADQNQPDPGA